MMIIYLNIFRIYLHDVTHPRTQQWSSHSKHSTTVLESEIENYLVENRKIKITNTSTVKRVHSLSTAHAQLQPFGQTQ